MTEGYKIGPFIPVSVEVGREWHAISSGFNRAIRDAMPGGWSGRRHRNPFPTFDWYPRIGATADAAVRVASTVADVRERLRLAAMALRGELTDDEGDDW